MQSDEYKINILNKIQHLLPLVEKLQKNNKLPQKEKDLLSFGNVFQKFSAKKNEIEKLNIELRIVWLSLAAIDQETSVIDLKFLEPLCKVESFYEKMGGLVGYHVKVLEMLSQQDEKASSIQYERPHAFDMRLHKDYMEGIKALPFVGEIYLVGGLGDRLKLMDSRGEPLPAALLPFLGKSLLEILIRDIAAREYLYYKMFQKRFITPIALMTSLEKENEAHIRHLLQENEWYGRDPEMFYLFPQILLPVIDENGQWIFKSNGECLLHPGGHGAVWKAAAEEGVYEWFESLSKKAFMIRQINNPIAGIDGGLITFMGLGFSHQKTLGIASCERVVNAAEGVLINVKKEDQSWATINIEYTDFAKHGIKDVSDGEGLSRFATNTNILYVNLSKILKVLNEHPIPDMLLNMKTKIGNVLAGRLESMMQNITHHLTSLEKENIPTFVTYNTRSKTISTTKKAFKDGMSILETPVGAFYELMQENLQLAMQCGMKTPKMCSKEEYLKQGPSFHFLYHPALGPFYDIITQKIRGGRIAPQSELQLEISELHIENLDLKGSLLIEAEKVCGTSPGFCLLRNVSVNNYGIDRSLDNCYWKNQISRKESCEITLGENAELIAENVTFKGNFRIRIPANMRWIAYEKDGKIHFEKERIEKSLSWQYQEQNQRIKLSLLMPSYSSVV